MRRASEKGHTPIPEHGQHAPAPMHSVGTPLETEVRQRFEAHLRTDLSRVRVHTDDAADEVATACDAQVFTEGRDLYFARGAYAPRTSVGDRLLGHALANVAAEQQASRESAVALSHAEIQDAPKKPKVEESQPAMQKEAAANAAKRSPA